MKSTATLLIWEPLEPASRLKRRLPLPERSSFGSRLMDVLEMPTPVVRAVHLRAKRPLHSQSQSKTSVTPLHPNTSPFDANLTQSVDWNICGFSTTAQPITSTSLLFKDHPFPFGNLVAPRCAGGIPRRGVH